LLAIKSRTSRPGIEFQKFSRSNRWSRLTSPLQDGSGGRNFRGTKKERRLAPPLRVEVSELRLRKTADPPRPFQLRPFSGISAAGSRSAGLLLPPYLSTSSDPRLRWLAPAPPLASGLAPFRPSGPFRLAPSLSPDPSAPKRFPVPDPTPAEAVSYRSAFRCFRCFQPLGLLRLSPPGVYLQGSRFPFESPCWYGRLFAEPGLGDMLSTT
jgi:hypothetical protein